MSPRRKLERRSVVTAALLALFAMAPSAGNIGSCGQEAVPLDAEKFFAAKTSIDCSTAWGLTS